MPRPRTSTIEVTINQPCGRLVGPPGWSRPRAASLGLSDHELWLVWRGRGWMSDGRTRRTLGPGSLVWMRPGGIYDAGQDPEAPLGFTFIHFTPHTRPGIRPPDEHLGPVDLATVEPIMRRIVQLIARSDRRDWGQPANAPDAATRLLEGLLLDLIEPTTGGPINPESTLARVRRLGDELRIDPIAAPPIADLAQELHITAAHFSRLFKEAHGQSPQQFLIEARLDRARYLLRDTDMPVSDIADALAYPDPFTFSKQFKRFAGQSPRAYRNAARG
ncbi:MAG: AraC family transcriptional regulator [Planctomycetota bacterium]